MSVFVNIARYGDEGPEGGNLVPLMVADLNAVVKKLAGYSVVIEGKAYGVELPYLKMVAELDQGVLSCPIREGVDIKKLLAALRKLAAKIPGAVVEDEEGNVI